MARQPSCFLDRFCLLTATISFFLKAPGAPGSHVRFLDAHANQTQRRRDCLSSLGTRHTEDAHHHTHPAHSLDTPVRTGLEPPPVHSISRSYHCARGVSAQLGFPQAPFDPSPSVCCNTGTFTNIFWRASESGIDSGWSKLIVYLYS